MQIRTSQEVRFDNGNCPRRGGQKKKTQMAVVPEPVLTDYELERAER